MAKCLIIIPAFNESGSILKAVEDIREHAPDFDYVVINDCSTDDTLALCQKQGLNYVNLPVNLGIGGAVQTGYLYGCQYGYEVAVQFDGDGQHDAAYLGMMARTLLETKSDMVIGSRFIEKEGFQSSGLRRIGIRFLSIMGWLLTGVRLKDITSGYRLVNRRFIRIFAEDYPADYPEPEAMVITAVHGGKIREYPVVMREREGGISSITLKKSVYYMVKVTIAMLIRRLSFGVRRQK